ncbi:lipopolysaccharide-induced tumor necrosis factor-alpha factor homolog [Electrophorus electricus]|uniref:LITAF domain-containing protein n=1 Tax=Electrophorus electricus TaxID=8005 RepID=A0AAY5EW79_ELEEL|nr:lipopolysaccharide-induced tumor necrosis factor-alpha factor homolog [Electrophorus electricus]
MASAPPLEISGAAGYAAPPSYEESMTGPQYPQCGPVPPPPVYTKAPQAPYLTQDYTQMYPAPASCTPVTNPVVSVQTVYVQPGVVFGDVPVQAFCPICVQSVLTRLDYSSGTMAWLICAGLCIFGCIYGCCLIPFCVDSLKDVRHHCPNCSSLIGVYKRL